MRLILTGGGETIETIYFLARLFGRRGHQVTIVTYYKGDDLPGLDIRRTAPLPWHADYEVGSSRHKIAFDLLLGLKTLQLLLRRRFDVIHAHLHEGALMGLVLVGRRAVRKSQLLDM